MLNSRPKLNLIVALKVGAAMLLLGHPPVIFAQSKSGQSIIGRWLTDDHSAIVRADRCGRNLCGRIERVLDPRAPANDINNPDPRLRNQPLVGTLILRNYAGSGSKWKAGRVYDPKTGQSYRSELELMDNGVLKVTGCILFLCRSRYWTRV